ncbi:MAG: PolC-type DNA polymerase III [Firmicutes bacterium]|nr:PolC-type DNA polymerase III [Bacillota bacterium]
MVEGKRTLCEVFSRYKPDSEAREILLSADNYRVTADKDARMIKLYVSFPRYIKRDKLSLIEQGIADESAYNLSSMRIFPSYPQGLFSLDYLPEIFEDIVYENVVSRGFFNDYTAKIDGGALEIAVPFEDGGIEMLRDTEKAVAVAIKREFSADFDVHIVQRGDYLEAVAASERRKNEILLECIRRGEDERHAAETAAAEKMSDAMDAYTKPLEGGADTASYDAENKILTVGTLTLDCSDPEIIFGASVRPDAVRPLSDVCREASKFTLAGEIFEVTSKESKDYEKLTVTIGVTDNKLSVYLRLRRLKDEGEKLQKQIKAGDAVIVEGKITSDDMTERKKNFRRDDAAETNTDAPPSPLPDIEFTVRPTSISKVKKLIRPDNAKKKRVELHLHTTMSQMDAMSSAEALMRRAQYWGHPAIAITDHGNVQAFPDAMLESEKSGMKVIYGMEAYFVDDEARAVYGVCSSDFDDEYVVFDIETTGLSIANDSIIEIGAVILRGGKLCETFSHYCNPNRHIPEKITELTGISDQTVANAETIDKVLPLFLEFCGDRPLIAHNASFDTGFIRNASSRLHLKFENAYIDTLAMSRYMNTDLSRHTLDAVANYYGLGGFEHHRAFEDAKMCGMIFIEMTKRFMNEGIRDISDMETIMSENADPLRLPTYHMIILVKSKAGLKNLYRIVSDSYLKYYRRHPRIPKTVLEEHRDGLIIGSACVEGELYRAILDSKPDAELERIAEFYDYLEIQPTSNNAFLISDDKVSGVEELRENNRKIVNLGKKLNKPVCATGDVHFMDEEDEIYRQILMKGMKFSDADRKTKLYFRTTDEMLEEFSYLGEKTAEEVVVENTNLIADMIEDDIRPIPKGTYTPKIDGAEEELTRLCYEKAHEWYGEELPPIVSERLEKELSSIIKNGYAVLYIIAQKLVAYSESQGYLVGSRGSVGSSIVASFAGISEVNPLPPHYRCPKCRYSEFHKDEYGSGFDMPDKDCPVCGTRMVVDGHDIPFETFLGFNGDKSPDIDLNFSGDIQGKVHKYTEELFGEENVFRAGTLGTIASKTAYGFVMKYIEDKGKRMTRADVQRYCDRCVGVKRSTGQHPGGIIVVPSEYDVYDFTPVQHPADDPDSNIITTHFPFSYLHDTILKLDELGHDIPTKYKMLEKYTGTSVLDVPMNDPDVYLLLTSTKPLGIVGGEDKPGTLAMPELGTHFVQSMLVDCKPKNFSDLLQISGLSHGTGVWLGNGQTLIESGTCDITTVIGCRDDIMLRLIRYGLDSALSFKIMEKVRKGKGLEPEWEEEMRRCGVPDWYIDSCKKIKYMFPKAHAAAYVMSAIRLGWYKINYPVEFYAAYFTAAPDGFDGELVLHGLPTVREYIKEMSDKSMNSLTQKEDTQLMAMQIVEEYYLRGLKFLPVNIFKSDARAFVPEDGKIRLPFMCLLGVGDVAAERIAQTRDSMKGDFFSVEELQHGAQLSKTVMDTLRRNGVLEGLSESNQLSMF